MPNSSPWGAFALSQLAGRQQEDKPHRFNPHPPGILQSGSATQAVFQFLQANPGRYFTLGQLVSATGRSDKSVDWACIMLRSLDRVEARRDESRNDRYFKYSIKVIQDEGDEL